MLQRSSALSVYVEVFDQLRFQSLRVVQVDDADKDGAVVAFAGTFDDGLIGVLERRRPRRWVIMLW